MRSLAKAHTRKVRAGEETGQTSYVNRITGLRLREQNRPYEP